MTEPKTIAAPLRITGLAALLAVLLAGIWSLWGPSPWERWPYSLVPFAVLLGAARQLARKPWSRLRDGVSIHAIMDDPAIEERPRLSAMIDAVGVAALLAFLVVMSRWMWTERQWVRLAALTPMTLTVAGFLLLRLKQAVRPG